MPFSLRIKEQARKIKKSKAIFLKSIKVEPQPNNSTVYLNLGDFYGYYFHDNQKAKENLLKAIKIDPTNIYTYQKTYEFYADIEQPEEACQILEQGIAANSNIFQSLQPLLNL